MSNDETVKLLLDAGFHSDWVVSDGKIILWEHDENPPAPLTRPTANETPTS
jgi:hypothetical protein